MEIIPSNYVTNRTLHRVAVLVASITLVACGGGGGGPASDGGNSTIQTAAYSLSLPVKLTSYPSTGVASVLLPLNDYGTATLSFPEETSTGQKYHAVTTSPETYGPKAHLTDVGVTGAWTAGWTGKGTTISIIDDFNTSSNKTVIFDPVIRKKDDSTWNGTYSAEYSVVYTLDANVNHGSLVANIAGGDFRATKTTGARTLKVRTDSNLIAGSCVINSRTSTFSVPICSSTFYENLFLSSLTQNAVLRTQPVPGVAAEALVITNTINLSSSQNPLKTVADLQGHLQNSASVDVINLSLGSEIPTSNRTFDEVMAEVQKFPLPRKLESVITVAAGNGGAPCATANLNGCNAVAVALAFQEQTKRSTIVVGALEGSGTSENMATYSTRAGILADRFILAPGVTGFFSDMKGTSFAAPRVAGVAAIIKQKYPSLTAAQIADVILLSADKDINNDGIPDFTGVSPFFGHGKLSLSRALALAGAL